MLITSVQVVGPITDATVVDVSVDAAGLRGAGYRLGEIIGRGGTADIYLAWPAGRPDPAPVALKLLRADRAPAPGALERLRREGRLLCTLRHPHIVRGLDDGSAQVRPFLAIELLGGGSLRRLVPAGGTLPVWRVAELLGGVADALGWLHRRDIVHADVKPANLLRDRAGQMKLIDFGCARAVAEPAPHRAMRVATPSYAAPELLLGMAPDPRDDVYSLAVVVYGLLAGRHPFGADPVLDIGAPARPAGLEDAGWQWLRAALAPARADRPADPAALLAAISACPARTAGA